MTPLPPPLGRGEIVFWRLDPLEFAATWNSGEGSFRYGGRWNSVGSRVTYACLDPATATLEVAVHKGFQELDAKPTVLTSARILKAGQIHVVQPTDVPNPNWLAPAEANRNQQRFGDGLLAAHRFVLIPSAVSKFSWNLIFDATRSAADYDRVTQVAFALDPRLQP